MVCGGQTSRMEVATELVKILNLQEQVDIKGSTLRTLLMNILHLGRTVRDW